MTPQEMNILVVSYSGKSKWQRKFREDLETIGWTFSLCLFSFRMINDSPDWGYTFNINFPFINFSDDNKFWTYLQDFYFYNGCHEFPCNAYNFVVWKIPEMQSNKAFLRFLRKMNILM